MPGRLLVATAPAVGSLHAAAERRLLPGEVLVSARLTSDGSQMVIDTDRPAEVEPPVEVDLASAGAVAVPPIPPIPPGPRVELVREGDVSSGRKRRRSARPRKPRAAK
jgi:hypothetical protein